MRLGDLQLAMELQAALARLDDLPCAEAELLIDDPAHDGQMKIRLFANELAAFIDWRRQDLYRQLRQLGVEPNGAPPMPDGGDYEIPRERSGTARKAPSTRGERIGDKPRSVGIQSAAQHRLTRAEAQEQATRIVMGPIYSEWQAGQLDDPGENDPRAASNRKFAELKERRQSLIDEEAARLMAGPIVVWCEECDQPSTTVVSGRTLCDGHAATAPRGETPLRLIR